MSSSLWIESKWLSNQGGGAPDVIGSFITPSLLDSDNFDSTASPHLFELDYQWGLTTPIGACGSEIGIPIPSSQYCNVYNPVESDAMDFVGSFTHIFYASFDDNPPTIDDVARQSFPSSASLQNYCHLMFSDDEIGENTDYFRDYLARQVAQGTCYPLGGNITLTCDTGGNLTIYQDQDCQIASSWFNLSHEEQVFSTEGLLGTFSARLFTVPSGVGVSRGWTTYFDVKFDLQNGFNVLQVCCWALSLLLLLCNAWAICTTRWDSKSTYYLVSTVVWLLAVCLLITSWVADTTDEKTFYLLYLMTAVAQSIAQGLTTIATCFLLHQILAPKLFITACAIYAVPLIAFILLNAGNYGWHILSVVCLDSGNPDDVACTSIAYGTPLYQWWFMNYYWTIFTFIWNIVPISMAAYRIVNNKYKLTMKQTIVELLQEKKYCALMTGNLFVFFFYLLTFCLQNYTLILDNDLTFWSMEGIQSLMMSSNFIITILIIDTVKTMVVKKAKRKEERKSIKLEKVAKKFTKKISSTMSTTKTPSTQQGTLNPTLKC